MSELSELYEQGIRCRKAAYALAQAETKTKDAALMRMADILYAGRAQILQANAGISRRRAAAGAANRLSTACRWMKGASPASARACGKSRGWKTPAAVYWKNGSAKSCTS